MHFFTIWIFSYKINGRLSISPLMLLLSGIWNHIKERKKRRLWGNKRKQNKKTSTRGPHTFTTTCSPKFFTSLLTLALFCCSLVSSLSFVFNIFWLLNIRLKNKFLFSRENTNYHLWVFIDPSLTPPSSSPHRHS